MNEAVKNCFLIEYENFLKLVEELRKSAKDVFEDDNNFDVKKDDYLLIRKNTKKSYNEIRELSKIILEDAIKSNSEIVLFFNDSQRFSWNLALDFDDERLLLDDDAFNFNHLYTKLIMFSSLFIENEPLQQSNINKWLILESQYMELRKLLISNRESVYSSYDLKKSDNYANWNRLDDCNLYLSRCEELLKYNLELMKRRNEFFTSKADTNEWFKGISGLLQENSIW
ncbi:hypothetical protein [Clostridium tarantellae]|uniref:Uncharacterized protein n=1 Tax=Clostridium tarantellae TaxID=39493 RepID=A0A6I1MMR8_9CLOT|nr:hypothetical protein [Clostridium tarantellae]MPQ44250.1 hypothetical protein [Clostridium tarantellae]